MRGKKYSLIFICVISFIFLISFILAVPNIQIHSPQNITYDSTKILLNVTSDEPVDFFYKNTRTGERKILEENVTNLESFIYVKNGSYDFIIWANDSVGETNKTVVFSTTVHNPISVTDCGWLKSSDAEYVLDNDISTTGSTCLYMWELRNVSFNLNGNTINSGEYFGLSIYSSADIEVFNGSIEGSPNQFKGTLPWILELHGTKYKFEDLNISGFFGITSLALSNTIFENVIVNSSVGTWFEISENVYFRNSSIIWNGVTPLYYTPTGFWAWADHATVFLEETNVSGFPDYDFYIEGSFTDLYLRSSYINMSKIYYPDWVSDTSFFKQHLVIININDQFNLTGACSVRILDNEILPQLEGDEALFSTASNPTGKLYIPTGETGSAQVWLTEKLTLARTSSPVEIEEYDFSNYTLTTRGWGSENYSQINLSLTDHNSTIYVDFKIATAVGGEELPACTITQMLDLNNDREVNIQDATIVLRKITGLPVSVNSTKECSGININPF